MFKDTCFSFGTTHTQKHGPCPVGPENIVYSLEMSKLTMDHRRDGDEINHIAKVDEYETNKNISNKCESRRYRKKNTHTHMDSGLDKKKHMEMAVSGGGRSTIQN